MELNTASQVVSLARKMEEDTAVLYDTMAAHSPAGEVLAALAAESRKNVKQIERVYYSVITDALEGCFAFKIDADAYSVRNVLGGAGHRKPDLNDAVAVEVKTQEFYAEAARQSGSLLADIPRLFTTLARKRQERISRLRTIPGGVV